MERCEQCRKFCMVWNDRILKQCNFNNEASLKCCGITENNTLFSPRFIILANIRALESNKVVPQQENGLNSQSQNLQRLFSSLLDMMAHMPYSWLRMEAYSSQGRLVKERMANQVCITFAWPMVNKSLLATF